MWIEKLCRFKRRTSMRQNVTEKIAGKWEKFFILWVSFGARTDMLKRRRRETEQEIKDWREKWLFNEIFQVLVITKTNRTRDAHYYSWNYCLYSDVQYSCVSPSLALTFGKHALGGLKRKGRATFHGHVDVRQREY